MEVACCRVCDGHVQRRHTRCHGGTWNHRGRLPNYISGYTGKIPINLRWTGQDDPCETRDFHSNCKEPVNTLYVVHSAQHLPDGTLEPPKVSSCLPCPLVQTIARNFNHPRGICCHDHPLHRQYQGYDKVCERLGRDQTICCFPCGCTPIFRDYRLMPPDRLNSSLKHGRCI